jgi:hypothetical protein
MRKVKKKVAAVRLLRHKSCALWRPIKLQIHLWTNRKSLSSVEYHTLAHAAAKAHTLAYVRVRLLPLPYATDCRMLLTLLLRSKLCTIQHWYMVHDYLQIPNKDVRLKNEKC